MSVPPLGFYGKLPTRGDFLRVSFSRSFAAAWDSWLEAVLHPARILLGERWGEAWWGTPPWRFSFAERGDYAPATGVWMPSADRAGRHFPLVVASESVVDDEWLEVAEGEARAAVAGEIDPEELTARLGRCSPLRGSREESGMTWWRQHRGSVTDTFVTQDWPSPDLFVKMLQP